MSDEQLAKPIPIPQRWWHDDRFRSDLEVYAALLAAESKVRELEQALQEIGKHTMESEDDIDFIIDACHAALRGAQP